MVINLVGKLNAIIFVLSKQRSNDAALKNEDHERNAKFFTKSGNRRN